MLGVGCVHLNRRTVQCYRIVAMPTVSPRLCISMPRVISAPKEFDAKQLPSLGGTFHRSPVRVTGSSDGHPMNLRVRGRSRFAASVTGNRRV